MKEYLDLQPDYYSKTYTLDTYQKNLKVLCKKNIYITSNGFAVTGRIRSIWEKVKGYLGFLDNTNAHLIEYEVLKFVHYGKVNKYFDDPTVKKIISNSKELLSTHANKSIEKLQDDIQDYHLMNKQALKSGVIYRYIFGSKIEVENHYNFGKTHLVLAKHLIEQKKYSTPKEILNILTCYYKAAELHNSLQYTKELSTSFSAFTKKIKFNNSSIRTRIDSISLLLAKRFHKREEYYPSNQYFKFTSSNLSVDDLKLWNEAAIEVKDYPELKNMIRLFEEKEITEKIKQNYIETCFCLLEQALPPPEQEILIEKILLQQEKLEYFPKLKEFVKALSDSNTLYERLFAKAEILLEKNQYILATQYLILSLQFTDYKERFSSIQISSLSKYSEKLYQNHWNENSEVCKKLLKDAYGLVCDIKKCFKLVHSSSWNKFINVIKITPKNKIQCNIDALVDENLRFQKDIGTKACYYYGEAASKLTPENQEEILSSYKLANALAKNSLFGAGELFLVDDQKSQRDDISQIINVYKKAAMDLLAI